MTNTKNHGGKREGAMRPPYKDRGQLKIWIAMGFTKNDIDAYGGPDKLKADVKLMVNDKPLLVDKSTRRGHPESYYDCPHCKEDYSVELLDNYCRKCGGKVKWLKLN